MSYVGNQPNELIGGDPTARAAAAAAQSTANAALDAANAHGQVKLVADSATNLQLRPYNGGALIINGVQRILTNNVDLSNSGMAANTLYYIYAYWTGSAVALEYSTTVFTGGSRGVQIKTGDATRTFVGAVQTSATSTFVDSSTNRATRSWFNEGTVTGRMTGSTEVASSSTSMAELSSALRLYCLILPGESINVACDVTSRTGDNDANTRTGIYIDGVTRATLIQAQTYIGRHRDSSSSAFGVAVSAGYHYTTILASVSSGSGYWGVSADNTGPQHSFMINKVA